MVVVLAILAVVTTLALRSLDHIQDQKRDEANRQSMQELRDAILGSPDDRAADGSRTISGFVADMGRLPKAVEIDGNLTLAELWMSPGQSFDVRPAIAANGVPVGLEDPQVLVSGGWRGPYLRLPIGASQWLDGWGNPMVTPLSLGSLNPEAEGYARLRDGSDNPLTEPDREIEIIRHLGANGTFGAADTGYDRDGGLALTSGSFGASLTAQVEVMDGDEPADVDAGRTITLCVFSPDPADPSKIKVTSEGVTFGSNPVILPALTGLTQGSRVIRAYEHPSMDPPNSSRKSTVKNLVLRPGANFVELKIDR